MSVEVLPLTTVNLLQNVHSEIQEKDVAVNTKGTSCGSMEAELEKLSLVGSDDVSEIVTDTDSEDSSTEESQPVSEVNGASEFGNTEFEDLILEEGPGQILQLTLQDQADEFMKEEVSDSDDYVDWIQWVSDAEEQRACSKGVVVHVKVPVVLQAHRSTKEEKPPNQEASLPDYSNTSTRWGQISQKFQIDRDLGGDRE
ncbi:unnamed protein product [Sphagnum jensenii]|uniref:Uncharacterized protein n=1 Tax=Sphagnum jensenii TaxID=128206 RepID=A0ABP1A2R2_9BRYO